MTSDSKIGLLLGLVFIFIIAAIIKGLGLPSIRRDPGSNELTRFVADNQSRHGLGASQRNANDDRIGLPQNFGSNEALGNTSRVRYREELPGEKITDAAEEVIKLPLDPVLPGPAKVEEPAEVKVIEASKVLSRYHTVDKGDSLASIAKKFYGDEEGNKRANIQKIYDANKDFLKSLDDIYPGQKLKIPPLESEPAKAETSIFNTNLFEIVKNGIGGKKVEPKKTEVKKVPAKTYMVGKGDSLASIAKKFYGDEEGNKMANIRKIFEANRNSLKSVDDIYSGQKIIIPPLAVEGLRVIKDKVNVVQTRKETFRTYTVREGDTLWQIATKQLGNGNRFTEISKLNNKLLSDEDSLYVGMKLKLPAK